MRLFLWSEVPSDHKWRPIQSQTRASDLFMPFNQDCLSNEYALSYPYLRHAIRMLWSYYIPTLSMLYAYLTHTMTILYPYYDHTIGILYPDPIGVTESKDS